MTPLPMKPDGQIDLAAIPLGDYLFYGLLYALAVLALYWLLIKLAEWLR